MQYCRTKCEIFAEFILCIKTEKSLSLHAECRLIFQTDAYICSGINDTLICNCDNTHVVIHCIVAVLNQSYPTGCYDYRTSWHIHRIKTYLCTIGCLVFTRYHKFILIGKLSCNGKSRII